MQYIRRLATLSIIASAPTIVAKACTLIEQGPPRTGGHLCVMEEQGPPILLMPVGFVEDEERAMKYFAYCQEKATRLRLHPGDLTSRQSRNEAEQKYAGAIRVQYCHTRLILSFSGLPEHWDEYCMVALAEAIGGGHPIEPFATPYASGLAELCRVNP